MRARQAAVQEVRQANITQQVQSQVQGFQSTFGSIIGQSTVAVAIMVVVQLLPGMLIRYHQLPRSIHTEHPIPFTINQLYRLLVAQQQSNAGEGMTPGTGQGSTLSLADELSKLAKLKEQGILLEAEFTQMKQDLIKKMP